MAPYHEMNGKWFWRGGRRINFTASEVSVVETALALVAGELKEAGYAIGLKTDSKKV
jgi:hypothetical protein